MRRATRPRAWLARWRTGWRSLRPERRRAVVVGAAVATALVVVVLGTRAWFSTRDATERTEDTLRVVRGDLARATDDLAAAVTELEDAQAALQQALGTLAGRRNERDAAQEALDASTAVLTQRQSELDASSVDLVTSTARLNTLTRCMVGVSQALNLAAVGEMGGSAATLRAIQAVCAEAGAAV